MEAIMRLLSIVCILAASAVLSPCTAGEIPAVDIGTGALTCVAMTRTADGQLLVAGRMGGILVYAVGNADGSKWSVTKLAMPELLDQTADVYAFADWAHVPMVAGTWRGRLRRTATSLYGRGGVRRTVGYRRAAPTGTTSGQARASPASWGEPNRAR